VQVGASFFIPCVNSVELIRQVIAATDKWGWEMTFRARIENGKWGVRFWRLL
jgi:hypothetical protein